MADSKARKAPKRRSRKRARRRLPLRWLLLIGLTAVITFGAVLLYYTAQFNRLIDARIAYRPPPRTAVLAADGSFVSNLWSRQRQRQRHVRFDELPESLVRAVLAAEDERFFTHPGVDLLSVARAIIVNAVRFRPAQGGSTLTQQFVKNAFLSPEKTLQRKLQEIYFAYLLERRLSKQEIFELYANSVYLGQYHSFAVTGFGEGAAHFFDKDVSELELHESALLAGLIQAPNRYAPDRNSAEAQLRRNHVLRLMEEKGFVSTAQAVHAGRRPLGVRPAGSGGGVRQAAWFVDFVREELVSQGIGWRHSSRFEVRTTLEPDLQAAAEQAVADGMREVVRRRSAAAGAEAALVAVRPATGELLALVGGTDYGRSQFNRALRARRQPGSTFKPFVAAAALVEDLASGARLTLASRFEDAPHTFQYGGQNYRPRNADHRYYGNVTLRETLSLSLNVPAVKMAERVGFDRVAAFSRLAGFPESHRPYPSIALGALEVTPLDLAGAYLVLAGEGMRRPISVLKSWTIDGALTTPGPPRPQVAVSAAVAYLVTSALESAVNDGTAREVRARGFAAPAAGKTGTTDDSWFAGYTPDLLCVVWVGFDDSRPLGLSGGQAALPIWTNFMKAAWRAGRLSGSSFPVPEGVVAVEIDPDTGSVSGPGCPPGRIEYFVAGTEPTLDCRNRAVAALSAKPPRQEGNRLWRWVKKIF